jgi:hypothetical protein
MQIGKHRATTLDGPRSTSPHRRGILPQRERRRLYLKRAGRIDDLRTEGYL